MNRALILALLAILALPATASAHTATPTCEAITLTAAPDGSTADITRGTTLVLDDVPGNGTHRVPPGTYTVTWDTGQSVGPLDVPECPSPERPRAVFLGLCGDPWHAARFINPTPAPVRFRWTFRDFDTDTRLSVVRWVPAGTTIRTSWRHVTGSTTMLVRVDGRVIAEATSGAPGRYRACWP